MYGEDFKSTFKEDFPSQLIIKGVSADDIKSLSTPVDYTSLMKLAIDYSDGVVQNSESVNEEVMNYARQSGKLVLDYQTPEAFHDACDEFYDKVWESENK
ncbi:hypothetical protein SDC9_85304 [bioreactor metagenome]|uniref:Uncharacterized protein n=1 Tax=bioreactor metagenome TaxID=1076179 RepID=A0A644ZLQ2_9ZZZZ